MKKTLLTIITVSILMSFQVMQDKEVFICASIASKRYHLKKTCKGLVKCDTLIKKTTKKKAEKIGRTLCKWED